MSRRFACTTVRRIQEREPDGATCKMRPSPSAWRPHASLSISLGLSLLCSRLVESLRLATRESIGTAPDESGRTVASGILERLLFFLSVHFTVEPPLIPPHIPMVPFEIVWSRLGWVSGGTEAETAQFASD